MISLPDISGFNGLDWFIVVVVCVSTLISLWRGFTREALSLAGWIVAFVLANLFASEVSTYLAGVIENITGRYIVAWSLIFLGVLVVSGAIAMGVSRLLKATGLGLLDRLLGTVVGFARGLIIVMALIYLLRELVPPTEQQWVYESRLMPHIDMLMNWSYQMFDKIRSGDVPAVTA